MNPVYRLWGREPALWLALISGLVMVLSAFFFELSQEIQGGINAASSALFGLLTAWFVARDGLHAAILGFFKALIYLAVAFGYEELTQDKQAILIVFLEGAVAMFVRNNATAPVDEAGKKVLERSVL
jgi:membrane associated rhomboid family serine protease